MKKINKLILLAFFYVCNVNANEKYSINYNLVNNDDMYIYALFGFDNNQLTREDKNKIAKINEYIKLCNDYRLVIIGHTDSIGVVNYNRNLASERVDAVLDYLVNIQHIPRDKIITKNRNEFDPAATNDTEQGRWRNRRVDIYIQRLSI